MKIYVDGSKLSTAFFLRPVLFFWLFCSFSPGFLNVESEEINNPHSTIPLSCLIWLHCERSWLADWSWIWRNSGKGFNTVALGGSGQWSHLNVTSAEFTLPVQLCRCSLFGRFLNFFFCVYMYHVCVFVCLFCFFRRDRSGDFHHRGCAGHNCPDHLQQERDVQEPGSQSSSARRRSRVSLPQPGGLPEHAHWQPEGILHLAGAPEPLRTHTPDRTDRKEFAAARPLMEPTGVEASAGGDFRRVWRQNAEQLVIHFTSLCGHFPDVYISKCKCSPVSLFQ